MISDRIEREIRIEAPVRKVWDVLTQPEHIQEWFGGATAKIDLQTGGEIVFHWQEHGTFHARIERLEPPHTLSYRWALTPDEPPMAGNSTLVEFTLVAEGAATLLRLVESGFQTLDGPDESRAEHLENNRQGWSGGLTALQSYAPRAKAS